MNFCRELQFTLEYRNLLLTISTTEQSWFIVGISFHLSLVNAFLLLPKKG